MTASTLDTTPRIAVRGVVSNAETTTPPPSYTAAGQALQRAMRPGYFDWLDHVQAAAGCTRPIRLVGTIATIEHGTGRLLDERHTDQLPDAAIYKPCGNRRATVCPSCARTYQRDAYQLLRAGLVGGKGVPDTVARHPAVFVTPTAPSFGLVHTRHVDRHTCRNRRRCDCRPDPCHARRAGSQPAVCGHGRPAVCWTRHADGDPQLGQPLCVGCYDYDHQAVWNLHASALWHRTKQAAERHLAKLTRQRGIPFHRTLTASGKVRYLPPVRLSHGKAAEMQRRGAVHFHALIRLDGVDPYDPDAVVPPPAGLTVDDLYQAVTHAARHTALTSPAHPDRPDGWPITWGDQVDVQPLALAGHRAITDQVIIQEIASQKAGYLAKYATKSTEATGHTSTRLNLDTIGQHADADGDHIARLIHACWRLGRPTHAPAALGSRLCRPAAQLRRRWSCPACGAHTRLAACPRCAPQNQPSRDSGAPTPGHGNPYTGLRRWAHMLGYGGHFLTKARRYSVTFTLLRATRIHYRRQQDQTDQRTGIIRAIDHHGDETTLIVGLLTFAGAGWRTTGDALLANTSAALARARHEAGREELAHEIGAAAATGTVPAAA